MVKCLNGGSCVWKDFACVCTAPLPGNMSRSCTSIKYDELPANHKLAYLLEASPSLCAGDCDFEDYLLEADWLLAHGVRVEGK